MSDGEAALPPKRDVALALLQKGSLFVHLDPRMRQAHVPAWLRQQPQLVLQVGYDMTIAIPDLRIDDDGVFGTLSFSRTPFACAVPWDAVFALVGDDGRGMVWPQSMPPEIAAEVDREAARAKRAAEERTSPAKRHEVGVAADDLGHARSPLRISVRAPEAQVQPVLGARKQASSQASRGTPHPSGKRRSLPPYLRVVK